MAKVTVEELKTTLKTDAGFTDEQLAGLTKAQLEHIANGYMRQSDYDRSMNEGKAEQARAQAALDQANERLNTEMAEWATLTAREKEAATRQRADLERAQADVLRLRQTVERVAADSGLDANKLLEGMPPPKVEQRPAIDPSQFVTPEQFQQSQEALANLSVTMPAELYNLSVEHQSIFGKPLDATSLVNELKARAATKGNRKSLNLREIWEEQHKVPDARAAAAQQKYDADMKAAEDRGFQRAVSESAIPGNVNAPGKHAPIFQQDRKSVLNRPQPGETVSAAVSAFRSGKYRPTSRTT